MTKFEAQLYSSEFNSIIREIYNTIKKKSDLIDDILGIIVNNDYQFGRSFSYKDSYKQNVYVIARDSKMAILSGDKITEIQLDIEGKNVKLIGLSYFVDKLMDFDLEMLNVAVCIDKYRENNADFVLNGTKASDKLIELVNVYKENYFNKEFYSSKCIFELIAISESMLKSPGSSREEIDNNWWKLNFYKSGINRRNVFGGSKDSHRVPKYDDLINISNEEIKSKINDSYTHLKHIDSYVKVVNKKAEEFENRIKYFKSYFKSMFMEMFYEVEYK